MERMKPRTVMVRGREFPVLSREEIRRRYLDDLPERLERFITVAGMTWRELAAELGVSAGRVYGWRRGRVPRGGAMLALFGLARRVPGGMEALYPELIHGLGTDHGEERPWE